MKSSHGQQTLCFLIHWTINHNTPLMPSSEGELGYYHCASYEKLSFPPTKMYHMSKSNKMCIFVYIGFNGSAL